MCRTGARAEQRHQHRHSETFCATHEFADPLGVKTIAAAGPGPPVPSISATACEAAAGWTLPVDTRRYPAKTLAAVKSSGLRSGAV